MYNFVCILMNTSQVREGSEIDILEKYVILTFFWGGRGLRILRDVKIVAGNIDIQTD